MLLKICFLNCKALIEKVENWTTNVISAARDLIEHKFFLTTYKVLQSQQETRPGLLMFNFHKEFTKWKGNPINFSSSSETLSCFISFHHLKCLF